MKNDLIAERIHAIRDRLLADCGGNFDAMMDQMSCGGAVHAGRVESLEELNRRFSISPCRF